MVVVTVQGAPALDKLTRNGGTTSYGSCTTPYGTAGTELNVGASAAKPRLDHLIVRRSVLNLPQSLHDQFHLRVLHVLYIPKSL